MFNIDIRVLLRKAHIYGYEVAAELGISESVFSRKLTRSELSDEEKEKIKHAIEQLKN